MSTKKALFYPVLVFLILSLLQIPSFNPGIIGSKSCVLASNSTSVVFEHMGGYNRNTIVYGARLLAQTFRPQTTHRATYVKLRLSKEDRHGDGVGPVDVGIYEVDENHHPNLTAPPLFYVSKDGDALDWWDNCIIGAGPVVQFNGSVLLEKGEQYAIVISAPNATYGPYVGMPMCSVHIGYYDAHSTYPRGRMYISTNGGRNWSAPRGTDGPGTSIDMWFEEGYDLKFYLQKYAPVLYLHPNEDYYPDPIDSMLNYADLREWNEVTNTGTIIWSNPPITSLTDYPAYNTTKHYLDMREAEPGYGMLTAWGHFVAKDAEPPEPSRFTEYPFTVYGRVVEKAHGGKDYIVLQYWFFYPYNKWWNCHEGDWERIQIICDMTTKEPESVTFGHHHGGTTISWDDVSLVAETHPMVFVGLGSHSSWPTDYAHPVMIDFPGFEITAIDYTSESGTALFPRYISSSEIPGADKLLYVLSDVMSDEPPWVRWLGNWGQFVSGRLGCAGRCGPTSPANLVINGINVWNDPVAWADDPSPDWYVTEATCPVRLHAYDPYGNHTGLTEAGEIEIQIPGTYFYVPATNESDAELMWIYTPENLNFSIEATSDGEFNFTFTRYLKDEDRKIAAAYVDVKITENTTATVDTNPENPVAFIMEIDLDGDGVTDKYKLPDFTQGIEVVNQPPVADIDGPCIGNEGSPITFNGSASYDPDGTIISYEWDLDNDGEFDDATGAIASHTWDDDYNGTISLKVTDDYEVWSVANTTVSALNVPPAVDAGRDQTAQFSDPVNFTGNFTDPGILDTHTILWDLGDETSLTGELSPTHYYPEPGIYNVILTVTDDDSGVGMDSCTVAIVKEAVAINVAPGEGFFNDTVTLEAEVLDDDGQALLNGPYEADFKVGDVEVGNAAISETGHAQIDWQVSLIPAELDETHPIEVSFAESPYYLSAEGEATFALESAKGLKQGALEQLGEIEAEKRSNERLIESAIRSVNRSLDDHPWEDASRLNPRMMAGALVFAQEKAAVRKLETAQLLEPELSAEIEAIISNLTRVDRLLAVVALEDAKSIEVENWMRKKLVERRISWAEYRLERGDEWLDKDRPALAINSYKLSWMYAQAAIKLAE